MKNLKDLKFDLLPEQQLYRKYLDEYDKDRDKDKAEKIKDALFKSVKVFKDKESGREYVIKKTTQDGYAEKDGQIVVNRDAFDQGTAGPDGKSVDNKSIDPNQASKGQKSPQLTEVLTLQQRQKRKMAFRRSRMKRKIGAEKSRKRLAGKEKLEKRSQKQARTTIIGRLFPALKDKPRSDWSLSDKKRAEKIVKDKKPIIKRFAKKMFKDVRKKEVERLAKYRSSKKEEVDSRNEYIEEQKIPTNVDIYRALVATKKVGSHSNDSAPRVSNSENLSDADFIQLIKDTFDGVTDVKQFAPEIGPNTSRTWSMFVFNYNGKPDCRVWLTGEIKGRGSKQTTEQEVSWLLILSAIYFNKEEIKSSKDPIEESILNEILDENVYKRVYGANGKSLDRSDALGLANWLKKNPKWLSGHLSQCSKFTNVKYPKAPIRFVKDRSNIPIVKRAKEVFHTSVPDQKFDKDKWNPADVWLEYEDFVPSNFNTLDDINRYLKNSISANSGIIGVSLKAGESGPKPINFSGYIPNYEVTDFKLSYGEFLAQNVTTEYYGNELTGFSVMYRLFDAKATSTIRGEASKKKSKAMHGKVFLQYMDYLIGRGRVKSVESVKGILVKQSKAGNYEWSGRGAKALKKVKGAWSILNRSGDMFRYNSSGEKDRNTYIKLLDKSTDDQEFLNYLTKMGKDKKISETSMQTRLSARFQTIVLGSLFASIKNKKDLYKIVLGMLLYGKSESDWSAPHLKVE